MLILALLLAQCPPPTGSVTITAGAGSPDISGVNKPLVSWNITCPPQSAACPNVPSANLTSLRTEFAAQPTERYAQGSGFQGASGTGPLPGFGDVVNGGHFQFSALAECNNVGSFVRLTSAPVVFKPVLVGTFFFVSERDGSDAIVGTFPANEIPVGKRVELRAPFEVWLAANEAVEVRVEGAGVSWSKSYSFPTRPSSASAATTAMRDDPAARFTFSQPGPVTVSMTLAGVKSNDAVFTVVNASGSSGGGSGSGGGGGASSTGGGGGGTAGGCVAAPGLLPLLALVLWRRRQRG
jgi:hypothetical protein